MTGYPGTLPIRSSSAATLPPCTEETTPFRMTASQPLRDAMRVPLHINSGYRSSALNILLRGARNSQHTKGEAADIAAPDPLLLAQTVIRNRLPFDQMILYSTFVHISHKPDGPQRGQILYDSSYKEYYPDTL